MGGSRTAIAIFALAATAHAARQPEADVDLVEETVTFEDTSGYVLDHHTVYHVLVANPGAAVGSAYAYWQPWTDERPVVEATVTRPDGTRVELDPSTLSEVSVPGNGPTYTDSKIVMAPLPGLSVGAVVDEHVRVRRRAEIGFAATMRSFVGRDPVTKGTLIVDAPSKLPLKWRVVDSDLKPRREEKNGRVRLTFTYGPIAGLEPESLAASKEPRLLVSTAPSWQAVASAWTARADAQIDVDAVRALAGDLTKGLDGRDAKVQAIRAWMAKNIRYTGLELGDSAWVPAKTATVLSRGFGDCKDMALLLVTFLRAVGVEADVALLDPEAADDVIPDVPGLSFMRHAIVRVAGTSPIWLDPTMPELAYGEVPRLELGHKALLARSDAKALVEIQSNVGSRLEERIDVDVADHGLPAVHQTVETEGYLYADARNARAGGEDSYRRWIEQRTLDHAHTKSVHAETSDPHAPGPFHETLDVTDATYSHAEGNGVAANLVVDRTFAPLEFLTELDKNKGLDQRSEPFQIPWLATARVTTVLRAPPGYRIAELPKDVDETAGPLSVSVHTRKTDDHTALGEIRLAITRGTLTAADARRMVREIMPSAYRAQLHLKNAILENLDKQPFAAVLGARELMAARPSPEHRALYAETLGSAGFPEAAATEARRALAEAPDDLTVRNRAALALSYDLAGVGLNVTQPHPEVVKVAEGSLAKDPKNEWARRLHILAQLGGEPDLKALVAEIAAYRADTKQKGLDGYLIQARVELGDWQALESECPGLAPSVDRDAACRAATLVLHGADEALRDPTGLQPQTAQRLAFDLVAARRYDGLRDVFRYVSETKHTEVTDPRIKILEKLHECHRAPGTAQDLLIEVMGAVIAGRLDEAKSHFDLPSQVTADELSLGSSPRAMLIDNFHVTPRRAGEIMCDFADALFTFDVKPIAGVGDLVIPSSQIGELGTGLLVRREKKELKIVHAAKALVAAEIVRTAIGHSEQTGVLVDALAKLVDAKSQPHTDLGVPATAPFVAAEIAATDPRSSKLVRDWLEAELERDDLTREQIDYAVRAYAAARKEEPDLRLAMAKRLEARTGPELQRAGTMLEMGVLAQKGAYPEALALAEAEIAKFPDDKWLPTLRVSILAAMGDFERARRLATNLNEQAFFSIFGQPDERAIEAATKNAAKPTTTTLNTLAEVDVALDRWEEAMSAFHRELKLKQPRDANALGHDDYWIRGRLAEALGLPDVAVAMYTKVTPPKHPNAADVYHLAAPRLKALQN